MTPENEDLRKLRQTADLIYALVSACRLGMSLEKLKDELIHGKMVDVRTDFGANVMANIEEIINDRELLMVTKRNLRTSELRQQLHMHERDTMQELSDVGDDELVVIALPDDNDGSRMQRELVTRQYVRARYVNIGSRVPGAGSNLRNNRNKETASRFEGPSRRRNWETRGQVYDDAYEHSSDSEEEEDDVIQPVTVATPSSSTAVPTATRTWDQSVSGNVKLPAHTTTTFDQTNNVAIHNVSTPIIRGSTPAVTHLLHDRQSPTIPTTSGFGASRMSRPPSDHLVDESLSGFVSLSSTNTSDYQTAPSSSDLVPTTTSAASILENFLDSDLSSGSDERTEQHNRQQLQQRHRQQSPQQLQQLQQQQQPRGQNHPQGPSPQLHQQLQQIHLQQQPRQQQSYLQQQQPHQQHQQPYLQQQQQQQQARSYTVRTTTPPTAVAPRFTATSATNRKSPSPTPSIVSTSSTVHNRMSTSSTSLVSDTSQLSTPSLTIKTPPEFPDIALKNMNAKGRLVNQRSTKQYETWRNVYAILDKYANRGTWILAHDLSLIYTHHFPHNIIDYAIFGVKTVEELCYILQPFVRHEWDVLGNLRITLQRHPDRAVMIPFSSCSKPTKAILGAKPFAVLDATKDRSEKDIEDDERSDLYMPDVPAGCCGPNAHWLPPSAPEHVTTSERQRIYWMILNHFPKQGCGLSELGQLYQIKYSTQCKDRQLKAIRYCMTDVLRFENVHPDITNAGMVYIKWDAGVIIPEATIKRLDAECTTTKISDLYVVPKDAAAVLESALRSYNTEEYDGLDMGQSQPFTRPSVPCAPEPNAHLPHQAPPFKTVTPRPTTASGFGTVCHAPVSEPSTSVSCAFGVSSTARMQSHTGVPSSMATASVSRACVSPVSSTCTIRSPCISTLPTASKVHVSSGSTAKPIVRDQELLLRYCTADLDELDIPNPPSSVVYERLKLSLLHLQKSGRCLQTQPSDLQQLIEPLANRLQSRGSSDPVKNV